jgi:hypothetical protein
MGIGVLQDRLDRWLTVPKPTPASTGSVGHSLYQLFNTVPQIHLWRLVLHQFSGQCIASDGLDYGLIIAEQNGPMLEQGFAFPELRASHHLPTGNQDLPADRLRETGARIQSGR